MTETTVGRAAAAVVVLGMVAAAAVETPDVSGMRGFEQRVAAYVALRQAVLKRVSPPAVSSDAGAIVAAVDALANAIRAARPKAQVGDCFTAPSASAFRRRIEDVLARNQGALIDLLAEIDREAPARPPQLTVNGRFDWQYGALMPADLIEALPRLPGFLQYRFVDRDLVLVDVEAGLVVDILPRALVPPWTNRTRAALDPPVDRCSRAALTRGGA
jgi:hypothetical protein